MTTRTYDDRLETLRNVREAGVRALLNFGHSFAHALETLTDYRLFLHGEAVAIGMMVATRLSELRGLCATGFSTDSGFVVISSRASFEMVYKAAAVGIELIAAVSAPTSMAVKSAVESGVTLVGFARPGRHNVYTFPERIAGEDEPE